MKIKLLGVNVCRVSTRLPCGKRLYLRSAIRQYGCRIVFTWTADANLAITMSRNKGRKLLALANNADTIHNGKYASVP